MQSKTITRTVASVVVGICGSSICQAEVTVILEGAISSLNGVTRDPNPFFELGDDISLSITFEEFTNGFQTGATARTDAITAFSGQVGSYSFGGSTGRIFNRNDGVVPGIFDGNPYDQLNMTFRNELANNGSLNIDRNDFEYDSGSVGEFRLQTVGFNVQTDDINMLNGLDLNKLTLENIDTYLDLFGFRMTFSNEASGSTPGSINASFSSITVIPAPSSFAMISLGGLCAMRRRR